MDEEARYGLAKCLSKVSVKRIGGYVSYDVQDVWSFDRDSQNNHIKYGDILLVIIQNDLNISMEREI